jgi:hypothetical protein
MAFLINQTQTEVRIKSHQEPVIKYVERRKII